MTFDSTRRSSVLIVGSYRRFLTSSKKSCGTRLVPNLGLSIKFLRLPIIASRRVVAKTIQHVIQTRACMMADEQSEYARYGRPPLMSRLGTPQLYEGINSERIEYQN
jgi:hypothetical protein